MNPGLRAFSTDALPVLLTLGAFDLVGEGETWLSECVADGTDLAGNPVAVEVAIQSLIQDGSVSYTEKYDNAAITIKVCLSGPDSEALDAGAAALFAEVGKPNTLTYLGPQAQDPVAWDVVNSHFERNHDDLEEMVGKRYYTITLSVLPFRRKTVETITPALPVGGSTTTNVATGSSATGWQGTINGVFLTPVTSSGAVYVIGNPLTLDQQPRDDVLTLWLPGPVNTSTLKFITVDWEVAQGTHLLPFTMTAVGSAAGPSVVTLAKRAQRAVSAVFVRTWFEVPASITSLDQIIFTVTGRTTPDGGQVQFAIDKVDTTNVLPTFGPGQQSFRSIDVGGSGRTPGTIAIEHETAALGEVSAFFWPDDGSGYAPPCSQYLVSSSGLVTNNDAIAGNHTNINGVATVYDIPSTRVPRDGYLLAARIGGTGTGTVTWTITTRVNGVDLGPTLTGSRSLTVAGNLFSMFTLAAVQLPTRDLDEAGAGAAVRISIISTVDMALDEVLIYRDQGQLVGPVTCGTGTPSAGGPSNRVFIEPPKLSRPRPVVRRGFAADRSDSFHPPSLGAWEFPEFKPPRVLAHVITTGTTGAKVAFRHFERLAG